MASPSLVAGISGLLTALFPDTTTQSGTTNSSGAQSGSSSSSSTPTMSSLQQMLSQMFGSAAMNQYTQGSPGVVQATKQQGLQAIGQTEQAATTNVSNSLAARGLGYSPYASTALAQPAIAAAGQQSSLLSSLPMLQNSLNLQNIGALEGAEGATGPEGTTSNAISNLTTSSTGSTTGKTQNQGILGSLFGGL